MSDEWFVVNADAVLQAVLFGESVLNDAVAIVLYATVRSLGPPTTASAAAQLVGSFFANAASSASISVAYALMNTNAPCA